MTRLLRCLLAFLVASWIAGAPLTHAVEYNFEALNYPGAFETYAVGLNNTGQIVGYYRDPGGDC